MQWKLFADLADVAGDRRVEVDVSGDATVGDALEALLESRPDLEERVLEDDGSLRDHINLLRNGANVFTTADGLDTGLEPDDELALFPPVSGGRATGSGPRR